MRQAFRHTRQASRHKYVIAFFGLLTANMSRTRYSSSPERKRWNAVEEDPFFWTKKCSWTVALRKRTCNDA